MTTKDNTRFPDFRDLELGEEFDLPPLEADVAQGFVKELAVALTLAQAIVSGTFVQRTDARFESAGIKVASEVKSGSLILRLRSVDGSPLVAEPGQDVPSWTWDEHDPGTLYVDASRGGDLQVRTLAKGGLRLHAEAGERNIKITEVLGREDRRPLVPQPLADVAAPIESWAKACPDPELARAAREHASLPSPVRRAVAAGLLARYWPLPDTPEGRAAEVERLLNGEPEPVQAAIRRWARDLDSDQLDTIEDLALAWADQFHARIEELSCDLDPCDEGWQASWKWVVEERDELESVRLILAEADRVDVLNACLSGLDMLGAAVHRSLPVGLKPIPDLTRKEAFEDFGAWWTSST